jgi:NCS2 family nucleobase:cation symporter-2
LLAIFQFKSHTKEQRSFNARHSSIEDVIKFLEQQGRSWGARSEVVKRAEYATWQAFEILTEHGLLDEGSDNNAIIVLHTLFNEHSFTVILKYSGEVLPIMTKRPSPEDMLMDDNAILQMAGYLLYHLADNVKTRHDGERCELRLLFND